MQSVLTPNRSNPNSLKSKPSGVLKEKEVGTKKRRRGEREGEGLNPNGRWTSLPQKIEKPYHTILLLSFLRFSIHIPLLLSHLSSPVISISLGSNLQISHSNLLLHLSRVSKKIAQ
jgi:hypothetical protein